VDTEAFMLYIASQKFVLLYIASDIVFAALGHGSLLTSGWMYSDPY
jgi:hypothetical protein